MLPRSFYFLRHGETDWNKQGRIQGHVDIPLNETGRQQAKESVAILQKYPIDRIISSPLSRALETAQIVNEVLQKPLVIDDRLREKNFGIYEGMTGEEIDQWKKENPDKHKIDPHTGLSMPFDGEMSDELSKRIFEVKSEILHNYPDENILFVAHGGVYHMLCGMLMKEFRKSANAIPFHFVKNGSLEWSLIELL